MGLKFFLAAALAVFLCAAQFPAAEALGTSAAASVLMEAESGRVLYENNADEPRMIASVTKLMTALVALESGHSLSETVTVQAEDTQTEGSSLYLETGEQIRLETLLYGLLLQSGNDAALAVARYCGGSVDAFVERMNETAAELGMEHSHFANPSGLNAPGHGASARDMALLARACLENETLAEIVSTRSITLEGRTFVNHNKLLWRYKGCVGLKTGYTEKAGRTLVSAAERGGMTLIAVTLSDPNDWADHAALFDWGFSACRLESLAEAGETVCTLPVMGSLVPFCLVQAGESLHWPFLEGETAETRVELERHELTAPVRAGERVGTLCGYVNGEKVGTVPLVCGQTVPRDTVDRQGFWNKLRNILPEF